VVLCHRIPIRIQTRHLVQSIFCPLFAMANYYVKGQQQKKSFERLLSEIFFELLVFGPFICSDGQVRLIRLQVDNFSLFLCKQADKQQTVNE
jgi:hypothetical protein